MRGGRNPMLTPATKNTNYQSKITRNMIIAPKPCPNPYVEMAITVGALLCELASYKLYRHVRERSTRR